MKSLLLLPVAASLLVVSCDTANNVEAPNYFVKYYGEEGHQEGADIVVNSDGTMLLFGTTSLSKTDEDKNLFLVKADAFGHVLWQRTFGTKAVQEIAKDVEVSPDGRIILLADIVRTDGKRDIKLIIASSSGIKIDSVEYGYAGFDEIASTVTQISDGFIVTGMTNKVDQKPNAAVGDAVDAFNFRFFNDLTIYPNTWNQTLGPGTFDAGVKVIQVGAGFYFFGYSNKDDPTKSGLSNDFNFWVFPLNNFGDATFDIGQEIFAGGIADERLKSISLIPVQSGEGYLLSGTKTDASGVSLYVAKLRKSLNFSSSDPKTVFQGDPTAVGKLLGAPTVLDAKCYASVNAGFLLLTNDNSDGDMDMYLTKIDNNLKEEWKSPSGFDFGGLREDNVGAIAEGPQGDIFMIGTFVLGDDGQKKMALIKVNKDGKFN